MDHRDFMASVEPALRAQLTEKRDFPGLLHLATHFGLMIVFGYLIFTGAPGWPLVLVAQGILIVFLFTVLHETVHGTAFRTGWINESVAWLCSLALVLPAKWFRYFHFAHHRHTQDPDNDPELATRKPDSMRDYIVHVSGLPVWKHHLVTLVSNASGRCRAPFVPAKGLDAVRREAIVMLIVYAAMAGASLALGTFVLLWVWLLPALIGQPFLRLYLLAEHGRCPLVANMLENSNSVATTWLVRKLAWNMPYHAEHHSWPGVPYHRLPALNEVIASHLASKVDGYAKFHRDYIGDLNKDARQ